MKVHVLRVLVIVVVGGVCSSASSGVFSSKPSFIKRYFNKLVKRSVTSPELTRSVRVGAIFSHETVNSSSPSLSVGVGYDYNASGDSNSTLVYREEKLNNVLDENLLLPRAMILRQLGLPLHNWLTAEVQDVKDIVAIKMQHINTDRYYVAGDELLDPGLARYLPSVYALSADDVLASADVLDDFGNPTDTGRHSHEKVFNLKNMVKIVTASLGDTGRRELIDNLNKLDVDETAELMPNFSSAWNLRVAQAEAEIDPAEEPPPRTLDSILTAIISKKQSQLELDKEIRTRSSTFAPSAQEIAQQEEELSNLQTIDAMPHSAERDTVIAEFHADYLTASNQLYIFTKRDLAWLQRTKIGQAALQDINLSALAALNQVAGHFAIYILSDFYVPINPSDKPVREQLLDLLDEHVQQALATR